MNFNLAQHPVTRDFMFLTKYTTPHGTEHETFSKLLTTRGFKLDGAGNYFGSIGDSDTLFIAHMDTADRERVRVRREVRGSIVATDGKTILGADDKAGCAVLLHLWRNKVPGNYLFVVGEERGMVGSTAFNRNLSPYMFMRAVAWDRFGYESIITHQMGERGCSDAFANALAEQFSALGLPMQLDPGGSYTDTYAVFQNIPECTNLSVGYFSQHTTSEVQDVEHLVRMAEASVYIEWETLPVVQDLHDRDEWSTKGVRTPKGSWNSWVWEGDTYVADPAGIADELVLQAQYGTLRFSDVEDFVVNYPEEAGPLLYDLLTRGGL